MLTTYAVTAGGPKPISAGDTPPPGAGAWVDVLSPSSEEDKAAEAFLGVAIPTREEAAEIEFSSRFYTAGGAVYMTVSVLSGVDAKRPALTPLTFVLHDGRLATVRYADFVAFRQFLTRSAMPDVGCGDVVGVLYTLNEAVIDRTADVVERIGNEVDNLNSQIFRPTAGQRKRRPAGALDDILFAIGEQNDIATKSRESLASMERMLQFIAAARPGMLASAKKSDARLKLMSRDIRSLADQLTFLSNKMTFLLEATLGLISVQQNEVIKVLAVAGTVLLPPTVVGTAYGMNFIHMPELQWPWGYPFALGLMALSAAIPFLYCKRRGWF